MNMKEAFYETGASLQKQGDTPEFERAILQTAVIYRIAQHREERARSSGHSVGEVIQSEEQAAIYKSLLFALIDEWLLDNRESPVRSTGNAPAFGPHSSGKRFAAGAAAHN